jgi:hypothetical protein
MQPLEAIPAAYRADPLGYYARLRERTRPASRRKSVQPEPIKVEIEPIVIDIYDEPIGPIRITFTLVEKPLTLMERQAKRDQIINDVCDEFRISKADIMRPCREHPIVFARQKIQFRLFEELQMGYSLQARFFNMDHSTIFHAVSMFKKQTNTKCECGMCRAHFRSFEEKREPARDGLGRFSRQIRVDKMTCEG